MTTHEPKRAIAANGAIWWFTGKTGTTFADGRLVAEYRHEDHQIDVRLWADYLGHITDSSELDTDDAPAAPSQHTERGADGRLIVCDGPAPVEVCVRVTINDRDTHEFSLSNHELNEEPEATARDLAQLVVDDLDKRHPDAVVCLRMFSGSDDAGAFARLELRFINGNRGWESQWCLRAWLLSSWTLMSETEAEYGPLRNH